jgi:hypothetical protein
MTQLVRRTTAPQSVHDVQIADTKRKVLYQTPDKSKIEIRTAHTALGTRPSG